jgi:hypothetical protein
MHLQKDNEKIEVEYVTVDPLEEFGADNPQFEEFQRIIEKFTKTEDGEEAVAKIVTEAQAAKVEQDGEIEDDKPKISKKQRKREKRISVAILKTLVKKPEVVEVCICEILEIQLFLCPCYQVQRNKHIYHSTVTQTCRHGTLPLLIQLCLYI